MATPVLSQVVYNGTQIRANFTYEDPNLKTFQIGLFEGTSTTPAQTAPSGALVATLINPQMNTTSVWSVAIAAVINGIPGPYGNRMPVIVGPPQDISVICDGSGLVLTWSPPAGATVVLGATISLFNATTGDLLDNTNFDSSPGVFRPTGGFNPAISYGVKLAGMSSEDSIGPYSPMISVIQVKPVFSGLSYTIAETTASIQGNSSTVNQTNPLGLYLYSGESLVAFAIAPVPGNFVRLNLPQPLRPESTYMAYLAYTVAGSGTRGPFSNSLPVLVEPGTVTSVAYDGINLSASWNNGVGTPPPTGGNVEITTGPNTVASANTLGTNIVIPSPPLTANTPYKLKLNVQRGSSLGPTSTLADVLTYVATPATVSYDGQNIGVAWTAVGGADVTGVVIALLDSGAVVQTQPGGTLKAMMAAALSPSGTYDIKLQTVGNRSTGPLGTAAPVISVVPRITGATYATNGATSSVEVRWNATDVSSAHGLTGYRVQLYENGAKLGNPTTISGATVDRTTVNLQSVLDPSKKHTVTVQALGGANSTGPLSEQSPIITASPKFISINYDGTNVTVKWTTVGQDGVSGYKLTVGNTTQTTSLTSITFAFTPTSDNPSISIITLGAAATGPPANTTLLTKQVNVQSTSYDGSMLKVTWQAPTAAPAYLVEVLAGTNVLASQMSTALEATLPVALSVSGTYSVAVRPASADGAVIGPRSTTASVIVATPTIGDVAYDGANVTGSVTAPGGVTLDSTTLKVSLYANGIAFGNPVSAAAGRFTIPATAAASAGLTVQAQVTGTKGSVAITAPLSPPVPVLTATPVIDSALLSFDGTKWNVEAAWSLPESDPTVGKFTVVLKQGGTTLNTWTVSGTSLSEVAAAFDVAQTLELVVTPKGNYGNGPAGAAAKFVPTSIGAVTSVVDGDRLTVNWTDAAGTSFTAHRLRLVQQVGTAWQTIAIGEIISGTTGFIELPSPLIGTAAVYGVTIDAAMGTAWTAANQVSPVIVQKPSITSAASASATSVAVAWNAPSSPTGVDRYQPVMVWEGGSLALATVTGSPSTLTIPASVPNGSWITLAAMKGQTTGPISESVAFITDLASGPEVKFDGATISAAWNAPEDRRVSAYEVTFTVKDQPAVTETVNTNSWSRAFTPTTGQTATVSVRAVAGSSKGPATSPIDAILGKPTITRAAFNNSQLDLTWTAVSDTAASAYLISVISGGKVIAEYTSGGTSATIPFAASAETIQIRAIGSSTSGPSSTAFIPISLTPNVTSIAFDTSGSLKIDWGAINGAGRYKVEFRLANNVKLTKNPTTNTLTLIAAELPPSGIYDVTVQAYASAANDDVSGPVSAALPAVVLPPPNVAIEYDGRTAHVTWEPINSPAVTGYVTTILSGATTVATATTVGPSASIPVAYASTNDYKVIVQALTSAGAGQPSTQGSLFQPGWYPSTATNATSYIIPATAATMSNFEITIYLPNLFTTYVSADLPAESPFVFSTTDSPPYSYKLTMPANSAVWTFNADPVRTGILTVYQNMLTKLVQLNVTPLGWRMVQDAISRAMPQTFAESLFYAYGFMPAEGYIDLKPGMLLRADFESYQYLGPDQTGSAFIDGFVSTSSAVYDVGSYVTSGDKWLTGFDAFLSLITQSGATVPTPETQGSTASGGGGIVDLNYLQFRKSFVRLVYPTEILGSGSADARPGANVAVLATDNYVTLGAATQNLRNNLALPSGVAGTYLRGRTTISACIRVWLEGQPLVVPVGTTVGNLLENMGRRAPITVPQSGSPGVPLSGIKVERSIGYAVTDPSNYSMSKGIPIRLDWNKGMAYSATTDWLNLPLLPGDRITTRGSE